MISHNGFPADRAKSRRDTESGQAMILMVLVFVPVLLGFAALATDVGMLFQGKRLVQTAADSGAIAGISELLYGNAIAAAQADASRNGMTNGTNGSAITVNNPPLTGPHAGNLSYVEVIASQSSPTLFMGLYGRKSMTVSARAVAGLVGAGQGCIDTLGAAGTDILLNGSVNLQLTQCGILDNSSASNALLANGTNTINARYIGVVGGTSQNGINSITPAPTTGIAPIGDPLAFLPSPSIGACEYTNFSVNGSGTQTLTPGVYCGGITLNGSPTVTFSPGVYIVKGGNLTFNGSATIQGTGVTFYLTNSAGLTINGGDTLNLTAPTSGTYNGILFFQDRTDTSDVTLNGTSSSVLKGILYFTDAKLTFNGNGSAHLYVALVTKTITFNGSVNLQDYSVINGSSPLSGAALVE